MIDKILDFLFLIIVSLLPPTLRPHLDVKSTSAKGENMGQYFRVHLIPGTTVIFQFKELNFHRKIFR